MGNVSFFHVVLRKNYAFSCEHDIHRWGRVFNVENLGLYGSACIKALADPNGCQEISFLIDAKVCGVQVEVSGCAAQALSSVLVTLMPEADNSDDLSYRPTYSRQVDHVLDFVDGAESFSETHSGNTQRNVGSF